MLRCDWQSALHGPRPHSFGPSRFCDFYMREKSALRSCKSATAMSSTEVVQQWPCGWPYPEAERPRTHRSPCTLASSGQLETGSCPDAVPRASPPKSRRRRSRWRRWQQLKRYVNFKVCYLSWLHLGRPAHSSLQSPNPMCAVLSNDQVAMCSRFLAVASTKCRPTGSIDSAGSGLSLFRTLLENLASQYTRRPQTTGPKSNTVPITVDNVSLPKQAGVVPLNSHVLPEYMCRVLHSEEGLLLPAAERLRERPPMFMDVMDWPALALRLLSLNM
eukprot:6474632-Amphidinium_carterae.1